MKRLLLCRLKRSELTSSTGVTSFILRLSFPSPFPAVSSPLSPDVMALAAIAASADTSPARSDFSEKDLSSAGETFQKLHIVTCYLRCMRTCTWRQKGPPMGVLCLSVCFNWLIRGGVTPTTGPISSPSLGSVKWKEISVKTRQNWCQIGCFSFLLLLKPDKMGRLSRLLRLQLQLSPKSHLPVNFCHNCTLKLTFSFHVK